MAMMALLCALPVTACGSSNSTRHRAGGSLVGANAPGRTRYVRTFPRLSRGARCPRTPGGHATHHAEIITLGDGPVYSILGFTIAPPAADGVIDYQGEGKPRTDGLWGDKILFARDPSYTGAFTVLGKQIDGPNSVEWLIENSHLVPKLEVPEGGQWFATEALFKSAGCYALRIDGSSFSGLIVFKTVDARTFRALIRGHHT